MFKCKCGSMEFKAEMVTTADVIITTESEYPEHKKGTENKINVDFTGLFICVKCEKVHLDIDNIDEINKNITRRCVCGNNRFTAHQVCYHDIIVGSDNDFDRDIGIGEAENPYGPYRCTKCDAEYEYLEDFDKQNEDNIISAYKIEKKLPDGSILIAQQKNDSNYPGIQIYLKGSGSDDVVETMCFIEYNPEQEKGKELCVCVYKQNQDEPKYYTNYRDITED